MTKNTIQCLFSIAFYFTGSGFVRKDSNQDNIGYSVMVVHPNSRGHRQCTLLLGTLDLQMDVLCNGNILEVDTEKVICCKHVHVWTTMKMYSFYISVVFFCCFGYFLYFEVVNLHYKYE